LPRSSPDHEPVVEAEPVAAAFDEYPRLPLTGKRRRHDGGVRTVASLRYVHLEVVPRADRTHHSRTHSGTGDRHSGSILQRHLHPGAAGRVEPGTDVAAPAKLELSPPIRDRLVELEPPLVRALGLEARPA